MTPNIFKEWIIISFFITIPLFSYSQRVSVLSGTIISSYNGKPISGVKVSEKDNTSNFVYTNQDGKYQIQLSKELRRNQSVILLCIKEGYQQRSLQYLNTTRANPTKIVTYLTMQNPPIRFEGTIGTLQNEELQGARVYFSGFEDFEDFTTSYGRFTIELPHNFDKTKPLTLHIEKPNYRKYVKIYNSYIEYPANSTHPLKKNFVDIEFDRSYGNLNIYFEGHSQNQATKHDDDDKKFQLKIPSGVSDEDAVILVIEQGQSACFKKRFEKLTDLEIESNNYKIDLRRPRGFEPCPVSVFRSTRIDTTSPKSIPSNTESKAKTSRKYTLPIDEKKGSNQPSDSFEGFEKLEKKLNSEIDGLNKQLNKKNDELAKLQAELDSLSLNSAQNSDQIKKLENDKKRIESEKVKIQERLKNSKQALAKVQKLKKDLENTLDVTSLYAIIITLLFIFILIILLLYFYWERKARREKFKAEELVKKLKNTEGELAARVQELESKDTEIQEKEQSLQESIHKTKNLDEEVRAQKENLDRKQKELKELQDARDSLTAMIVHDLKNPLNHVLAHSNTDARQKSMAEIQKGLITINQAGRRLNQMSTNILQIQKWESTTMPIEPKDYNLCEVANEAISQVEIYLVQNGIRLENNIPTDLWGYFDKENIFRVFDNLLSNAIKYTNAGDSITIDADELNRFVRIDVSDTGKGMSTEKMERAFDKFVQDDSKLNTRTTSVGLGLTFCKMVMEAHGTSIDVKSVEGKGTTFSFYLKKSDVKKTTMEEVARVIEGRKKIELTTEEKAFLLPFVHQIQAQGIGFKDITKIEEVVEQIDSTVNGGVQNWREALQECADNPDEKRFELLINRVLA